ncbi:MAG: diphthamide biosynthesis enzyme Dph2 [Candidatus Thermoplasmatota archaeon]|nr:diphthamide biosynthesis enzyme Dph2 [Candidatus Thermoplasmatota archaeon]
MPEGLKTFGQEIASRIGMISSAEVVIDSDPCFGACDIPVHLFGISDVIIQIGHTRMPSIGAIPKMYFANILVDIDPVYVVRQALPMLRGTVGLVTTAQHIHHISSIVSFLEGEGINAIYSRGDMRLDSPAQLLGCDYSAGLDIEDRVDMFLYVGDGDFHPIGLAVLSERPLVCANPMNGTVRKIDSLRDVIMKQRLVAIERAMQAKTFGVLVSSKLGQRRRTVAEKLLASIKAAGRSAALIQTNIVTPELIGSYGFDAFASTVCPRVAIDDYARYPKPILTPVEAEIAIGARPFSDFRFDQILAEQ